jgi:hypothetical protein
MAADLVLEWQGVLREFKESAGYPLVNDLMLLEAATLLGAVDSLDGIPVSSNYRDVDSVDDAQLEQVFAGLEGIVQDSMIDQEYPIGPVAASSISEPVGQGTLRTFHYAGVQAKKDAFELLNAEIGKAPNISALVAMALPPEIRMDELKCRDLAKGLKRGKLGDFVGIVKDSPAYRDFVLSDVVGDAWRSIEQYDGEKFDDSGGYSEGFSALLVEYRRLRELFRIATDDAFAEGDKAVTSRYFFYLKTEPEGDGEGKDPLKLGELTKIIRRQIRTSDGMIRGGGPMTPKWVTDLFRNADTEDQTVVVGEKEFEGVILSFPFLTSRLSMSLLDTLPRLEFCNKCKHPVTLAKFVQKRGKKTEKVEDPEWDTTAPVTEYHEAVIKAVMEEAGLKVNPEGDSDSTGLIEVDMSESDRYDFEIGELGRSFRRCGKCKHGWFNVDAIPVKFQFGAQYHGYDTIDEETGLIADFKSEDENPQFDVAKHIGGFDDKSVYPEDVGFLTYPGASRKGQNSDYPLAFLHGGRLPNDPIEGEWYILLAYKDANDGRMSALGGASGWMGHFETAAHSDFIDFNRTTTSDARQVELVLGIEAARTQLAHNLFNAQGNGAPLSVAGNSTPVHYKHYLLVADTLCNGIKMSNARGGSASVSGAAAMKGFRSVFDGERYTYYKNVLAQAYERQVGVLFDACAFGLTDDLSNPTSAQIAGQELIGLGSLGKAKTGRYATVPVHEIRRLKWGLEAAENAVNQFSKEHSVTGRPWVGSTDMIGQFAHEAVGRRWRHQDIAAFAADARNVNDEPDFRKLLLEWGDARDELGELLDEYGLQEANASVVVEPDVPIPFSSLRVVELRRSIFGADKRTREEVEVLRRQTKETGSRIHHGANVDLVPYDDEVEFERRRKLQELRPPMVKGADGYYRFVTSE